MSETRAEGALIEIIRERGPLTVAAFMEFALYDPRAGYYARASRRSGRAGDFFTSVDVGAEFGRLLAVQVAEMARLIGGAEPFDLVEAGAGSGRLSADVLRALQQDAPSVYERTQLQLVEASAAAGDEQRDVLGETADRLRASSAQLPDSFEGVLFANELLDAMPVHQVVMRPEGLREVHVAEEDGRLVTTERPLSSTAIVEYFERLKIRLEPGWRAEVGLTAVAWVREAARRLRRGFLVFIDYGHPARELYSVTHSSGTLTSYHRHTMSGPEAHASQPAWLSCPGEQDITAHVDFTSIQRAAEDEGLTTLGFLDQTYFLLGLCAENLANLANPANLANLANLKSRLALKTLLMPGGLGSTMKVLLFGKGMGTPALQGCSYRVRAT